MADDTPTTEDVRHGYASYECTGPNRLRAERFDRWLTETIRQAKDATLHDVIGLINFAREEGETDLRQVRAWVEALIAAGDDHG